MRPIVMQDWVTIKGTAGNSVSMDATKWIDTGPYQDFFAYVDVREATNITTINIETSPNRDELMFTAAGATTFAIGNNLVRVVLSSIGTFTPIGAWTRWRCVAPAGAWDITFRILAAGNSLT